LSNSETLFHSLPEGVGGFYFSVEINWLDNHRVEYEVYKKETNGTYTFVRKETTDVVCQ
jgi:hypothetical protein